MSARGPRRHGETKTGGNYACSLKGQEIAHEQGYSRFCGWTVWNTKYIEEVGAMNVFFVIGDEIVTPMLTGSILPGYHSPNPVSSY